MLFRYRARNYPETLAHEEMQRWHEFCGNRLTGRRAGAGILFEDYFNRLEELKGNEKINPDMVTALEVYAFEKMERFGVKLV
jgi:exodeoxyribonuclease-1